MQLVVCSLDQERQSHPVAKVQQRTSLHNLCEFHIFTIRSISGVFFSLDHAATTGQIIKLAFEEKALMIE